MRYKTIFPCTKDCKKRSRDCRKKCKEYKEYEEKYKKELEEIAWLEDEI